MFLFAVQALYQILLSLSQHLIQWGLSWWWRFMAMPSACEGRSLVVLNHGCDVVYFYFSDFAFSYMFCCFIWRRKMMKSDETSAWVFPSHNWGLAGLSIQNILFKVGKDDFLFTLYFFWENDVLIIWFSAKLKVLGRCIFLLLLLTITMPMDQDVFFLQVLGTTFIVYREVAVIS